MTTITTDQRLLAELPRGIQLNLGMATTRQRPLADVNAAMQRLDLTDEEVIVLVDQGLLIAFNISAGERVRYLMILTRSIDLFKESRGRKRLELEWPEIFKLIFGRKAGHPALTGLEIKRGLNCTRQHVGSLSPFFETINVAKPGRGNTPSFTTASVERWLKGRLL